RFKSLPPETASRPRSGLRGSNQTGAPLRTRIRIASPSVQAPLSSGLSVGSRLGTGSLGQVWPARCRDGLARLHIATASGFFLLDIPAGFPKGISSAHHGFVETRKGVPTNWAGTPRCALCRPLRAFCQVSISRYQV